jgi:hypothetical protein
MNGILRSGMNSVMYLLLRDQETNERGEYVTDISKKIGPTSMSKGARDG